MKTNTEEFRQALGRWNDLMQLEPSEDEFFEKYHHEIEGFFLLFVNFKNYNSYQRFIVKYLGFWKKRLQPYRIASLKKKTLKEIREGKEYFIDFLRSLEGNPSLKKILGKNKLAFIYSNYYAVEAYLLLKERGNVEQILTYWQKAGEACTPFQSKFPMPEQFELLAEGAMAFSQKHKLKAFFVLGQESRSYEPVIASLKEAKNYAEQAQSFYKQLGNHDLENGALQNIRYHSYWINIFTHRDSLIKKDFEQSRAALKEALSLAKSLDPKAKRIFPNYYRDLADLENEIHFVQACESLSNADLYTCKTSLEIWLGKSDRVEGTQRYINIFLRKEAIECLDHLYGKNDNDAYIIAKQRLKDKLDSRINLASHTRSIAKILDRPFATKEGACGELYSVFPLDTYPSSIYEDTEFESPAEEKLRQLPAYYREWLNMSAYTDHETALLTVDYVFISYLRTVVEHCYHYFCLQTEYGKIQQSISSSFSTEFDKLEWGQINASINALCSVLPNVGKGSDLRSLSDRVISYQEQVSKIRSEFIEGDGSRRQDKEVRNLAAYVQDTLEETGGSLFPHPVKVIDNRQHPLSNEQIYTFERAWDKAQKYMTVILKAEMPQLKKGAFYFLSHKWKGKEFVEYVPRDNQNFIEELLLSRSFGIPHKGCILLYEGDTEEIALPILLESMNRYWTMLDIKLIKGGGDRTVQMYDAFRQESRYVVVIADKDVQEKATWSNIIKDEKNTFLLDPDFEGIDPTSLVQAIQTIYPELPIDVEQLAKIMKSRLDTLGWRQWGGTIDGAFKEYLRNYVPESERSGYKIEKTKLAGVLTRNMVEQGLSVHLEHALNRILALAEGREEYE